MTAPIATTVRPIEHAWWQTTIDRLTWRELHCYSLFLDTLIANASCTGVAARLIAKQAYVESILVNGGAS